MDDWQKIGERKVNINDKPYVERDYVLPSGAQKRFLMESPVDSVGIFALTLDDLVLCVRQFRPGTEQVYDELPGGHVEIGEDHLSAAKRELLEETGYRGEVHFVARVPKSAYRTNFDYCYVALNCMRVKDPSPDEHEFLEVIEKPLELFKDQLMRGDLTNAIVGLYGLRFLEKQ